MNDECVKSVISFTNKLVLVIYNFPGVDNLFTEDNGLTLDFKKYIRLLKVVEVELDNAESIAKDPNWQNVEIRDLFRKEISSFRKYYTGLISVLMGGDFDFFIEDVKIGMQGLLDTVGPLQQILIADGYGYDEL